MNRFADFLTVTRFSLKDKTLFAKRLAFLVGAGVPILDSLVLLRRQTSSCSKGKVFDQLISDVSNGQYLANSLSRFNHIFGDFAVSLIRVGETGGVLSQNLNYLSDELKKRQVLRRKIIGALIYPVLITVATILLTGLLTVYIFPKIMPIFSSLQVVLPWTTKVLIFTSGFLRNWWAYLLGSLVILTIGYWFAHRRIKTFRIFIDRLLLYLPIAEKIVRNYNLANISRTLGLLLKSGFRVVEAIEITAETSANLVYRRALERLALSVSAGRMISAHLQSEPQFFPDILMQLVAVGETSGNLSETLFYLSEMYEQELDELIKNFSSTIEPVLMIFMGVIVGFVAVSVITPIYEITQTLSK